MIKMLAVKKEEQNKNIDNNLDSDSLHLPTENLDIEAAVVPAHVNVPVLVNARIERLNELPGICFIIFLFGCLFVFVFITGFNII